MYTIDFSPGSFKSSFYIYPGEVNGTGADNFLQVQQTDSVNDTITVYGDYSYRFTAGFALDIVNSTGNDGGYLVSGSQACPLTSITALNSGTAVVTIPGDWTLTFTAGRVFAIQSSTNNDGRWMTRSSSYSSGYTTIILKSSSLYGDLVPSGIRDGASLIASPVDGAVRVQVTVISISGPVPVSNLSADGELKYRVPSAQIGTSLLLPGPGKQNYGELIIENLVRMLEHFCSTVPPSKATKGQLWYNPPTLKVYDGVAWQIVGSRPQTTRRSEVGPGSTFPTPTYQLGSNQLSVYKNGLKLQLTTDYTETSTLSATLVVAAGGGDTLEFVVIS